MTRIRAQARLLLLPPPSSEDYSAADASAPGPEGQIAIGKPVLTPERSHRALALGATPAAPFDRPQGALKDPAQSAHQSSRQGTAASRHLLTPLCRTF